MHTTLLILNLVAALASASWAGAALFRPAVLSGTAGTYAGKKFYSRMYAARSIPLGLLAGALPFWAHGLPVACVLLTAAAVQLADVGIALSKPDRRMMRGALGGAVGSSTTAGTRTPK